MASSPLWFRGVDLQGPAHRQELSSQVTVITDGLTGQRPNPPPRPAPKAAPRGGPAGVHLGELVEAEDLPAVVLPVEAPACQSFQVRHHFIHEGRHHKRLTVQTGHWKQTQVCGGPSRPLLGPCDSASLVTASFTALGLGLLLTGLTPHLHFCHCLLPGNPSPGYFEGLIG